MKTTLTIILVSIYFYSYNQTGHLEVLASSGDYYTGQTITMSMTFGESFTETLYGTNLIATQGFQQPLKIPIKLDVQAFLEGPFSGTEMLPFLNFFGFLPLQHPYSAPPWTYQGAENVPAIPNPNIIDWVLVELRDTPYSADSAGVNTRIERKAAFLLRDGRVVDTDGASILQFKSAAKNNIYVVLYHRNHLGIMSAYPLTKQNGIYTCDFTSGPQLVYGGVLGYKQLGTTQWGMVGGDGDASGTINNQDKMDVWNAQSGTSGYLAGDFNMSGNVDNQDKLDIWVPNSGSGTQVPDSTPDGGYSSQIPM